MRDTDQHECLGELATYLLAITCLVASAALGIRAAPADLDPTFGNGGKVITTGIGAISDIAIQPDGKIVAVGGARIVRYNANGSLDSSFGTGGIVIIQLGGNISGFANSVALQADGKIVVAGGGNSAATGNSFAVVRYNPNGTLDTTFNGTGIIITPYPGGSASGVAIQTDGKVVVVGRGSNNNGMTYNSAVFRYSSSGTPDTSFNSTGSVITAESSASSVAIQPDGKILVGGSRQANKYYYQNAILRYNAEGSPDTSFGDAGSVFIDLSVPGVYVYESRVNHIAIQSDGKIIAKVSGAEINDYGDYAFTLFVRYTSNGWNDGLFYEAFHNPFEDANPLVGDLAIQANGKIVTVGNKFTADRDFAIARYNSYGLPDATFTDRRFVTTGFGGQDEAAAVAIQPDGKIVAAGVTRTGQSGNTIYHFALARYQDGSRTPFDFDGDGRADVSVFRGSDRIWYLNQSSNGFSATQFGLSTDAITPADYDGDARTDISVYRDGTWYWLNSFDNSFNAVQFGIPSDIPVPANYDTGGNGGSELAVFRNGTWWILNLTNNQVSTIQFGLPTDKPVVGDYDGDGRADQAVYRNGEWHLRRSTQGYGIVHWGLVTDIPVPADYDGDGKTDPAVYRDGTWYLAQSLLGWGQFNWGTATDILAPADYDGDGKTDPAVYRDGVWYLRQSTGNVSIQEFGLPSDKPVASASVP